MHKTGLHKNTINEILAEFDSASITNSKLIVTTNNLRNSNSISTLHTKPWLDNFGNQIFFFGSNKMVPNQIDDITVKRQKCCTDLFH